MKHVELQRPHTVTSYTWSGTSIALVEKPYEEQEKEIFKKRDKNKLFFPVLNIGIQY